VWDADAEVATAVGYNSVATAGMVWDAAGTITYDTLDDLLDDDQAPDAAMVGVCTAFGYFRLGSSPAGQITADIVQGATAGNRTAGQFFVEVLNRAGVTDYVSADVAALDTANSAELGYWTASDVECGEVLDDIARTVGAWWGVNKDGSLRIVRLTFADTSAAAAFSANGIIGQLVQRVNADGNIPVYQQTIRHSRVYAVQTDLAGVVLERYVDASGVVSFGASIPTGFAESYRATVSKEWRQVVATNSLVVADHPYARTRTDDTLFTTASDASTEASRRLGVLSAPQDVFEFTVPLTDDTETLDLGDVVTVTNSRYGLTNGRSFRVVTVEPDLERQQLRLRVWGLAYELGSIAVAPTLSGSGSVA